MGNEIRDEDRDIEGVKSLATQGSITFVGNVFGKLVNFTFLVLVTNTVTASTFGVFSLGLSIVMFSKSVTDLSVHRSLDYYIPQFIEEKSYGKAKYIVLIATGIGLLGTGIAVGLLFFTAPLLSELFNEPRLASAIIVLAFGIPLLTIRDIHVRFFVALKELKYRVLLKNLVHPLAKLLLTGILLFIGFELTGLVTGFVLALIVVAGVGTILLVRRISTWENGSIERVPMRGLLSYSFPLMFAGVVYATVAQIDYFVIGFVETTTAEDLAVYKVATQFGSNLLIFLSALAPVFKPMITEAQDDVALFNARYTLAARWVLLLTLPVAITFMLIPEVYLSLFFSPQYAAGGAALTILAVGYLVNAGVGPENMVLEGLGHTRLTLFNTILMIGTNTILDLLLVPHYGIIGAAIGTSAGMAFAVIAGVVEIKYLRGIIPFGSKTLRILMAGVPVLIVGWLLTELINSKLILAVTFPAVASITFLGFLKVFKAFSGEDRIIAELVEQRLGMDLLGWLVAQD